MRLTTASKKKPRDKINNPHLSIPFPYLVKFVEQVYSDFSLLHLQLQFYNSKFVCPD